MTEARRLHWGCGPRPAPGWINADLRALDGVDLVGDIRDGLALRDAAVDCAVAIHALQDLPWLDIPAALGELRRVIRPGGVLRLSLPDMDRAIDAYRRGDAAYFHVPDDDAQSVGAKLVAQLIWYGSTRTPFNFDCARELLERAGFREVRRCAFHLTHSVHPDIVSLDDRERESLFVEATA
ncbi:MAG TPA: methyltransferase domain-containing protein [Albitalea sp.]|jgi:predicted SAM-dependent methyltransferase|nr:methyltransferase domain-containing protein [Albitalea sp.]